MPGNLLNQDSIIRRLVNDIPEEDWRDSSDSENGVEVIGWLYQFYISERKDEVIGAKSKIAARDIPAATQLFTPHWIVRYMVENSLGRLWLEGHPESGLRAVMKYYLESPPEEGAEARSQESEVPSSNIPTEPQELTVLDPACGSGHILVYAFDLLFEIYKEQGYRERDIPALILEHNLHGLDIDERAVQLASFAVLMKARAKNPRLFRNPSQIPHLKILTVRPTRPLLAARVVKAQAFPQRREAQLALLPSDQPEQLDLADVAAGTEAGIFSLAELNHADWLPLLEAFRDADNLGSLITPPVFDAGKLLGQVEALERNNPLFGADAGVLRGVVEQAELLRGRYWVVVANPPYMSGKSFDDRLKTFATKHYPRSKDDLFAMFMECCLEKTCQYGLMAMINQHSWMFLSSYEKLRQFLLRNYYISSMLHLGYGVFKELNSKVVQSVAFVASRKETSKDLKGVYLRLVDFQGAGNRSETKVLEAIANPDCGYLYYAKSSDFEKMPGSIIAYWLSPQIVNFFSYLTPLENISIPVVGLQTGNNDRFIRLWQEVKFNNIARSCKSSDEASASNRKWFPYTKGGDFRRWYGNNDFILNWQNNGCEIVNYSGSYPRNKERYFQAGITYTNISSSYFAARYISLGSIFDQKGSMFFAETKQNLFFVLGLLHSTVCNSIFLKILCPTLDFNPGSLSKIPVVVNDKLQNKIIELCERAISISQEDWDNFETSWDFQAHPLVQLSVDSSQSPAKRRSLKEAFRVWEAQSEANFQELKRLEEENNRYWIDAYGLQDELTPEVPDEQITIRRADLERDIKSLISYAVGCMMGRYSLQRPGLILASQGQSVEDYWRIVNSSQLTVTSEQLTVDSSQQEKLTTDNSQLTTPPPEEVNSSQLTVTSEQQETPLTTGNWQLTTAPPLTTDNCQLPTKSGFQPDTDAILPITDQAYFDDDIVSRFVEFIKVAFGPATLTENLDFIANALKLKSGETAQDRIRRYFVTEFIADHIRTYKKRPIYWLFTSGKKRAFGALVYLHRYTPDTVGRIRTDYILELQVKLDKEIERLQAQADTATTTAAKRAATKRLKELQDQQLELRNYQAKVQTFGDKRIALDLDDGVAYNYTRFKGIVYEGTDLKMKDLEAKAQWKLDLLKQQKTEP